MGLFNRREDSVYAQGAYDSPANRRHREDRRREAILETWRAPVWPKLARILFVSMLLLCGAMLLVEIKSAALSSPFDARRFFANATTTLLWVWGIYTALLAACCLAGGRVNRREYLRRKADSGIVDATDEERARSARAVRRLNASYRLYLRAALIGLGVLALLFLLARRI